MRAPSAAPRGGTRGSRLIDGRAADLTRFPLALALARAGALAVRYHDGSRCCCALLKVGTKNIHLVVLDDTGVRLVSEPRASERYCSQLLLRGQPYPVALLVKNLRRLGRERGITRGANDLLAAAKCDERAELSAPQIPTHRKRDR